MKYLTITLLAISFIHAEDSKTLPTEAQQVVDAMELQISKARQECLRKLDKIIGDITKTGNLEAALLVKNKETEIRNQMPRVAIFDNPIVGKWRGNGGWQHEYKSDGTAIHSNYAEPGKWSVAGNKLIVSWANGGVDTFFIVPGKNTMSGSNGSGRPLTSVKVSESK